MFSPSGRSINFGEHPVQGLPAHASTANGRFHLECGSMFCYRNEKVSGLEPKGLWTKQYTEPAEF